MLINRGILGKDLRFVDFDGGRYSLQQFTELIDRWKAFLSSRLKAHEKVAVYADNTILTYALSLAFWERGICFYGDNFKSRLLDRALNKVRVEALFVDDDNFQEAELAVAGQIPVYRIPSLKEFLSWDSLLATPDPVLSSEDEILIGFTSGTVGESRAVFHTHSSLLAPSGFMAKTHYQSSDSVLIYLNLNHLGYISCILLASFRAGAEIHILHNQEMEHIFQKIHHGQVNVAPLFSYNWFRLVQNYPQISLAKVDRVVTGGDFVSNAFASSLLRRGVKKVLNVYGLTEALPPVAIKVITEKNISLYSGENLGTLSPYDKVRFLDGEILVQGANQGRIEPSAGLITEDGFTKTGDSGRMKDDELFMTERKKYFIQLGSKEISASDLKHFLRTVPFKGRSLECYAAPEGIDIQIVDEHLVFVMAALSLTETEGIDLKFLNCQLAELFGPEIHFDHLLIEKDLPFNGIKLDRAAIRRRILGELENAAGITGLKKT